MLAVLLVLVVGVILLAPTLISTGPGTRFALGLVNSRIAGSVEVNSLNVAWFGPQLVEGLRVRDAASGQVLTSDRVAARDASLFAAISGASDLGKIELTKFVANVERYDDGTTNVQRALAAANGGAASNGTGKAGTRQSGGSSDSRSYSLSLEVVDAEVTYKGPNQEPVVTTIPTAVIDMTDMSRIRVNIKGTVAQGGHAGSMDVEALVKDLYDSAGNSTIDRAHVKADAKLKDVPIAALDAMLKQDGLLVALLGPQVNGDLAIEGNLSNLEVRLDARSEHFSARAAASGGKEQVKVQGGDAPVELTVTPEAWTKLAARYPAIAGTRLRQAIPVRLALKHLSVPLDAQQKPVLPRAALSADLTVGDVVLDSGSKFGTLGLRGTTLSLQTESLGTKVHLEGAMTALQNTHSGRMGLDVTIENLLDEKGAVNTKGLSVQGKVELSELPVALIEQFAPKVKGISDLIGTTLSAKLDGHLAPTGGARLSGPVTLTARAQHLSVDMSILVREDGNFAKQAGKPATVELMLTPAGFQGLLGNLAAGKPQQIQLARPARLRLDIEDALLAWLPPGKQTQNAEGGGVPIDLRHSKLLATLTADTQSLHFPNAAQLDNRFRAIRIKLNAENPADAIQLDVEADVAPSEAAAPQAASSLVSNSRISGIVGPNGGLNLASASIVSTTRAAQVPVALLDAVTGSKGRLIALLGQIASFTLETQRLAGTTGPVKIQLESDNARASVSGLVDEKWNLTLTEDLKALLQVTPQMSNMFLASLNPLLADVHSSEKPVELTVAKAGFHAPLKGMTLANVTMDGDLEIGTLKMRHSGIVGALLGALRRFGGRVQNQQHFDARFTRLQFKVADGVITSNDLWMDTGDMLLGAHARVRSPGPGQNLRADVLIGVPGETLRIIPKLAGNIRPEALYKLTAFGPMSKLEPDFASLILPIVTDAVAGEALGDVGGVLGQIIGAGVGELLGPKKPKGADATAAKAAWRNAQWPNRPPVDRARQQAADAQAQQQAQRAQPPPAQPEEPKRAPKQPDALDIFGEILKRR